MKDGELTLEGFLQLHQMEAEDNGGRARRPCCLSEDSFHVLFLFSGDSAELWITLNAMGYNVGLVQDESAIFEVIISSWGLLQCVLSDEDLQLLIYMLDNHQI